MKIVCVFNMRGGIGKTTTAVALAESMAFSNGHRVLLIDLDPQRNASARLCPQAQIDECGRSGNERNVAKYLLDAVTRAALPSPEWYISKRVGTIHGTGCVDLLMGSMEAHNVNVLVTAKSVQSSEAFGKLAKAFKHLNNAGEPYDVAIVDCPPSLTALVQGALSATDLLLVPVVVQNSSWWHYKGTHKHIGKQLPATGFAVPDELLVATRYKASHAKLLDTIRGWFKSELRLNDANGFVDTEFFNSKSGKTPREKYGTTAERQLNTLAHEVAKRLGLPKNPPNKPTKRNQVRERNDVRTGRSHRGGVSP